MVIVPYTYDHTDMVGSLRPSLSFPNLSLCVLLRHCRVPVPAPAMVARALDLGEVFAIHRVAVVDAMDAGVARHSKPLRKLVNVLICVIVAHVAHQLPLVDDIQSQFVTTLSAKCGAIASVSCHPEQG